MAAPARGEEAAPAAPPAFKLGYDKGFFLATGEGDYKLKLNARFQARYTYESAGGEHLSAFSIPRTRVKLTGNVFTKALSFDFQVEFGAMTVLKDAYFDYAVDKRWLTVRAGQWKKPFSRQQINSSGRLELIDRAITDKAFGAGRDIGLALLDTWKAEGFHYALGVFNGTGDKAWFEGKGALDETGVVDVTSGRFVNVPDRFHPEMVVRVGYDIGEIDGYSESDLEGGGFRLGLGASAIFGLDADPADDASIRAELDYALKVHGFAATGGVYLAAAGPTLETAAFSVVGGHHQVSYAIIKRVVPVLRYEWLLPDGAFNDQHGVTAGLGFISFGHEVKLQTDLTTFLQETEDGLEANYRVRAQAQFAF
jgi:hypothetical protein